MEFVHKHIEMDSFEIFFVAFSYASILFLASTKIFVSSANYTNSALLLMFGRPLI